MIKYLLNIILIINVSAAQDFRKDNESNKDEESNKEVGFENKKGLYSKSILIDNSSRIEKNSLERKNLELQISKFRFFIGNNNEKHPADFITSVSNNISFGGFWEKYAVVNFTPQLYIKPVGFISIYANHYLNCLIPVGEITEYSQTMILQSITILTVENSMKILFNNDVSWIAEVVTFAAKNLLLNTLIKPAISNSASSSSPILQYENYYYSMSIAF